MKLFPILCNYYVTTRCNARCSFCNIHLGNGKDAESSDVLQNLKQLRKLGVSFVDFTGGEPLLYKNIDQILKAAKKLHFITTLTTNCILYPEMAQKIRGLVDLLHFSLDSPFKHEHDAIRGVKCFDRVMESISIAKSIGENPDIIFTVNDKNVNRLYQMATLAKKNRLILIINPEFNYFKNHGLSIETLDSIEKASSYPYVYVNKAILKLMKNGGNSRIRPRCRAMTTTIVISPDNSLLVPCYHRAVKAVPINGDLNNVYRSLKGFTKLEGRFSFCQGCTISCYFDPSFVYGFDTYFFLSNISKLKYVWYKYIKIKKGRT